MFFSTSEIAAKLKERGYEEYLSADKDITYFQKVYENRGYKFFGFYTMDRERPIKHHPYLAVKPYEMFMDTREYNKAVFHVSREWRYDIIYAFGRKYLK